MTATAEATPLPMQEPFHPGLLARAVGWFSGGVGLTIKIALLSLSNALGIWAAYTLYQDSHWIALGSVLFATAFIDIVYLLPRKWTAPAKFKPYRSLFPPSITWRSDAF